MRIRNVRGARAGGLDTRTGLCLAALGVALAAAVFAQDWFEQAEAARILVYEREGNVDAPPPLPNPSGIVFHPGTGTLFAVGDKGHLAEIGLDGAKLRQRRIRHADFEGIAVNPATGLLYLAVEGDDTILEVDAATWDVRRTFVPDAEHEGRVVFQRGDNQGLEGIAFVPDPTNPEGGTFFVTNQGGGKRGSGEPSALVQLLLPLNSSREPETSARILRVISPGVPDLSDCQWCPGRQTLFVLSDKKNTLLEMDIEGRVIHSAQVPGEAQEGIALDDRGHLYIAQDSGGILKLRFGGFRAGE